MSPVGIEDTLRFKLDRRRAVLQTRKRKLCELYTATRNEADTTITTPGAPTEQNLIAFLSQNDLEVGLTFREPTLPPRNHFTRQRRRQYSPPVLEHTTASRSNSVDVKSPEYLADGLSLGVKNDLTPGSTPVPRSGRLVRTRKQPDSKGQEVGIVTGGELDAGRRAFKRAASADSAVDVETDGADSTETLNDKPSHSETTAIDRMDVDDEELDFTTPKADRVAVDTSRLGGQDAQSTSPDKSRRGQSPLVLAPVTTAADPQSSPASTSGPASSSTPAPTAGSPETSPGDEAASFERKSFAPPSADQQDDPTSVPDVSITARPAAEHSEVHGLGEQGATGASSRQQTPGDLSQRRPPMRIDTQAGSQKYSAPTSSNSIVGSPAPMTTATPRRTPLTATLMDQPKRATRISSGALQKKSVSEILGETPKTLSPQMESPLSSTNREFSPTTTQLRLAEKEKREKERSKLSTVVFAKPPRSSDASDTIELVRKASGTGDQTAPKERDYLYSLFESRAYSPPKNTALSSLIHEARKTVSTTDHLIEYREQMNCRAMKRIYQLQNADRWALRQRKRAEEVVRQTSHWDFVLDHAKWMRTDFREERKWKLAAASATAEMCAEWVASTEEQRKMLQVRVKPPTASIRRRSSDVAMEDGPGPALSSAQPTPELIPSADDESISDGIIADPREISLVDAPAAIFSLGPRELAFAMEKTLASEKLLNELPLYEPARIEEDMSKSDLAQQLDARWKQAIVPISRFANEAIHQVDPEPPRKRSRYSYELEDLPRKDNTPLPPSQTNVALFQPENKHMRDRIHPGHSFRPPTEHPMPTQVFFESRNSSQWTTSEDDTLKRLVKDYSYNWSLISAYLTSNSTFSSGADRRTPWECFERWILLEGLPADMSKTPYFRAYHSRIEAAGRHVQAQVEAAQARAGVTGQAVRRRTTIPVKVERKRNQKYLAMLDAMRKLAKKRETALQKQQHQADLAAMRKANEANQPKPPYSTPAEFSRLKHDREIKMAERQEQYRQQLLAHQRATQQRGQPGSVNGMPNGGPRMPGGLPNGQAAAAAALGIPNGNLKVPPGSVRPQPVPGMPNGLPNGMPLPQGLTGATQAQMQQFMAARAQIAGSPEAQRRIHEAQIAQAQIIAHRQAQQGIPQNGTHSSPNIANASMANGNTQYLASLAASNGAPSPLPQDGTSRSPRNQNALGMAQALSTGQIPLITQISNHIRQQFPHYSDEQVMAAATQQLSRYSQQVPNSNAPTGQTQRKLNQAALNAAMGAANAGLHASNIAAAASANAGYGQTQQPIMTNEQVQQYNQRMRVHQAQAAQRANGGFGNAMGPVGMVGMGSSPVMNMARPVSQQGMPAQGGQVTRSATPREQRSGSNGNSSMMGTQGSPRQ